MARSISDELRLFAAKVVRDARTNTKNYFPKGTGSLGQSLTFGVNETKDVTSLIFWMNEYGIYVDAGVFGAMRSSTDKMKWAVKKIRQKGRDSDSVFYTETKKRFSYQNVAPNIKSLIPYIKKNNIRFRNPKGKGGGQYRKGGVNTIAYWMAQRIYAQGFAPTLFFTRPFLQYFGDLSEKMSTSYATQIEEILKQKLEKNGKN
tara:strand:+ start:7746 stop:8354 length:609 start_codon:yes stop_codon:yes gene_type:complete